jgi:IS30 family transposase
LEGNRIEISNNTCIAPLVERHSRYVALIKLDNKNTESVTAALVNQATAEQTP